MLILLPLLRKLPIRTRAIVGAVVAVLGLTGLFLPGLFVTGAIAVVVGLIFLGSAWSSRRRALAAG